MGLLEFWILFTIVAFILELLSMSFFLLSLGFGSITAGILSYYNYEPIQQVIGFGIITIICIILSRPIAKKLTKNSSNKKTTSDRFINQKAISLDNINSENSGIVKISGEKWSASSEEDIVKGEEVIVKKINGVKLVVEKIK